MERVKILRIITRMNIGGPAIHAVLLSAGLDSERFSSLLVTGVVGRGEGDMSYLATENGIEPLVISELQREPNIVKDIVSFYKLYRFIKKEKPDIAHTHTAKAGAIGRLAAKLSGVPVIIHTFHGHTFHSYFSPFKTKIFLLIEKTLTRITDKIVVIGKRQSEEIKRYLYLNRDDKLALIPLGFDLSRFLKSDEEEEKDKLREELNIPVEAMVIGIIGRLTAVKNHRMFLETAREIKKKNADKMIKFVIVGNGELKEELMALSDKLGIKDDAVFTDWRKDMNLVYRALDIVVLTSLNEGTPVSLIEGLASAKAVVATDVGGVHDVVENGKSGFVVPMNDVEAFSEAVSILMNDGEKRKRFGLYGRDFVKDRYSKDKLIDAIENLYCKELQKKRRQLNQ